MNSNVATLHKHVPPALRDGHNWDAIKMRYELLGEPLTDLAREYNVSHDFLVRLSEAESWEQQAIPEIVHSVDGIDASELMDSVRQRVDTIQIYKELALLPALLEIESSLVQNLKTSLASKKQRTPKDMKMLVDAFTTLTSRQRIFEPAVASTVPKVTMNLDTSDE